MPLTSVILPDSLTRIGFDAFAGTGLTSVSLPSTLVSIGSNAFSYNKLTNLTIPNSVTEVDAQAFYANQLQSLSLGSAVRLIGGEAFAYNQLNAVTIPDSVECLGCYFTAGVIEFITNDAFNGQSANTSAGWTVQHVDFTDPGIDQAEYDAYMATKFWYAQLYVGDPNRFTDAATILPSWGNYKNIAGHLSTCSKSPPTLT